MEGVVGKDGEVEVEDAVSGVDGVNSAVDWSPVDALSVSDCSCC